MDHDLMRFREAAARENRGRRTVRRRYSPALQQQAVEYWRTRRHAGDGLRDIAVALGVAPWSLHRWTRRFENRARFEPVQVVAPASSRAAQLVVVMGADGPRVEGLTLETAAQLLLLLR